MNLDIDRQLWIKIECHSIKRWDCIKAGVTGNKETHCQQKKNVNESLEMRDTEKAVWERAVVLFHAGLGVIWRTFFFLLYGNGKPVKAVTIKMMANLSISAQDFNIYQGLCIVNCYTAQGKAVAPLFFPLFRQRNKGSVRLSSCSNLQGKLGPEMSLKP